MASRDLELSYSSNENTVENTETFQAVEQPLIFNPSSSNTDDSSSESCGPYNCNKESQSELSTPSIPSNHRLHCEPHSLLSDCYHKHTKKRHL